MALETYRVEEFKGIDQSRSENKLNGGYSPDAVNMDTANGDLAVGYGYSKHIATPVPDSGIIHRMYLWHTLNGDKFIVAAGNAVYAHMDGEWRKIYTYAEDLGDSAWDFEETRIGTTDYLLIANGKTQMIKWDGENDAALFGSGEYVYEGEIEFVEYNAVKATAVSYAEAEEEADDATKLTGRFTLTMPSWWRYEANTVVAFTVPQDMGDVKVVKIGIGSSVYTMTYVPIWSSGDTAAAVLTTETEAVEYEEAYGVKSVTLVTAIPAEWVQRTKDVGINLGGVTEPVYEVGEDRRTVELAKVSLREIEVGMEAKVRGGISDHPVNFVETYFNRLFSAGDPRFPSRLYWSQPPGDTRSIEDWSMDDASDAVSGGHVEIGQTSNDPIVGLCALSNQLIIYKQSSVYRLIGDRPTNYRVTSVNRGVERMVNTARVLHGDVPFWMTKGGMYYHDGQNSALTSTARQIKNILETAFLDKCKAAENADRLYFTIRQGDGEYDDAIIVYDMRDRGYMLRSGFKVADICAHDGTLYMINDKRVIYRWDKSTTYDGDPIHAYWKTPFTDMGAMSVTKELSTIHLRGEGGLVKVAYKIGRFSHAESYYMKADKGDVLTIPLIDQGRAFCMEFYNEGGSWFKILGGVDLRFRMREDGV